MKREGGFAFIFTAAALTILAGSVLAACTYLFMEYRIVIGSTHAERARSDVLLQLADLPFQGAQRTCESTSAARGDTLVHFERCVQPSQANGGAFPAFKFGAVFESFTRCLAMRPEPASTIVRGRLRDTCTMPPPAAFSTYAVSANLELVSIDIPTAPGTATIGALGSLDLGAVTTARPLLIVSGGDLSIGALHALSQTPLPVTLVTAHGKISLSGFTGEISISTYEGASQTIKSSEGSLVPPSYEDVTLWLR